MSFFHVLSTGAPTRYEDIIADIAGGTFDYQVVLKFDLVTRAAVEASLNRNGVDMVMDFVIKEWMGFSYIELSDSMLLSAVRDDVPLAARVGRSAEHQAVVFTFCSWHL
jgi:hypothetical protein